MFYLITAAPVRITGNDQAYTRTCHFDFTITEYGP